MSIKLYIQYRSVKATTNRIVVALCCILLLSTISINAQETIRFKNEVFQNVDSITNVVYGNAVNVKGEIQELLLDVFSPHNDTLKYRPLLIFIHGGGFQNNSKTGSYSSLICNGLAKRGYVTTSIDYRLGLGKSKSDTSYYEALYRAIQDAKAAVRFFRRYSEK